MVLQALINKQDNLEVVRDQIAALLLEEVDNQQVLATAESLDPDPWKLRIFTERSDPWAEYMDLPESDANPGRASPIVNVCFDSDSFDMAASNVVERQKTTAVFNVDCYGYGVSRDVPGGGHAPGDQAAALECIRAARLVRNILMASSNTYLGLRGLVWRRWLQGRQAFQPQQDERPVQNVQAVRLALQVEFSEFSPQYEGQPLELLSVTVKRAANGEIYFTREYSHTS